MYWLIEDVIMEFLPPGSKGGMSYCCRYKGPRCMNSGAALILKDSSGLQGFLNFLSRFEEFMKE
jgi:hypothetical protein